jgi:hypothetical protein
MEGQSQALDNLKLLLAGISIFVFLLFTDFYTCPFRALTGFPCIGCGLTSSFKAILRLDFLNAFKWNVLSIPIFILLSFSACAILFDFAFQTEHFKRILYVRMSLSRYVALSIIVIIGWITNIIFST